MSATYFHADRDRSEQIEQVCRCFDVPVWLVAGRRRPRLFRVRWALRRFTGFAG